MTSLSRGFWIEESAAIWAHGVDGMMSGGRTDAGMLAKLDGELNAIRKLEIEVKRRRNACLPLSQLPPEILRRIMSFVAADRPLVNHHCGYRKQDNSDGGDALGWISLGHVCHFLRSVVFDYHSLWAKAVCVFPGAFNDILSRSGQLPVSLVLPKRCSHSPSRIRFMINHLPQALEFIIRDCWAVGMANHETADKWPLDPALFSGKAFPLLQQVNINFDLRRQYYKNITKDIFELPPAYTPRLRRLVLRNFYIQFQPNTLHHLELCSDHPGQHAIFAPPQFLDMLRACGNLRSLILGYWLPPLETAATPTISLPFLSVLNVTDAFDRCLSFWSYIIPSQHACPVFALDDVGNGLVENGECISLAMGRFQNVESSGLISGLTVRQEIASELILQLWTNTTIQRKQDYSSSVPPLKKALELTFILRDDWRNALSAHKAVQLTVDALNPTNLQYLGVWMGYELEPEYMSSAFADWSTALTKLIDVRTLDLGWAAPGLMFPILSVPDSVEPVLPALRLLSIHALNVSQMDEAPPHLSDAVHMVLSRKRAGVPLAHIRTGVIAIDGDVEEAVGVLLPRWRAVVPLVECLSDDTIPDWEEGIGAVLQSGDTDATGDAEQEY
ncbi:hypothetical protein K488DRAFT_85144 [Vararia minispora EC-137]|uniref:Uncharacterized protein n=1 Tax=Vararia minispora EC-137 TaxID=1314806 RepID=A0ACB8QMZ0_9AGAM|nr:hypothetical protein K488DRAFT_85144 [Vararia minispora EC-137]